MVRSFLVLVLASATLVGCRMSDAQRAWCDTHATEVAVAAQALGEPPPANVESWSDWVAIGPQGRELHSRAPSELERACRAAYEGR